MLQMLRLLFGAFTAALVVIGVVVAILALGGGTGSDDVSTGVVALGIVGYGVLSLVLPRLIERPMECTSEAALAASYQTRFFLRIAIAEAAALAGFVGFLTTGAAWLYALGVAFAAVGFARAAPSSANLERDQEALNQTGCAFSLLTALHAAGPTDEPA